MRAPRRRRCDWSAPGSVTSTAGSSPGRCSLPSRPSSPEPSALAPTFEALPTELRDRFVADVLSTQGEPLRLDYVRLNIDARAPR